MSAFLDETGTLITVSSSNPLPVQNVSASPVDRSGTNDGDNLMKTIAATVINDVITPTETLPNDAKLIVFNGTEYVIYEDGDKLPTFE